MKKKEDEVIIIPRQWKVFLTKGEGCISTIVSRVSDGYEITTQHHEPYFVFRGYKTTESIKKAKDVIRVLEHSLNLIEEQLKMTNK